MQVTINIPEDQMAESLQEMIKGLSPEKKEELCTKAFESVIDQRIDKDLAQVWGTNEIRDLLGNFNKTFNKVLMESPQMEKSITETVEKLMENLPEMTQQAMTILIAQMLTERLGGINDIVQSNFYNTSRINHIASVLNIR